MNEGQSRHDPLDDFHYYLYSDLKRVRYARDVAKARIAWRAIAGLYLDKATACIHSMTDWLNKRGKK